MTGCNLPNLAGNPKRTKKHKSVITDWNPIPADIRGIDLLVIAWRDCLLWAMGYAPIMERFAAETGRRLDIGGSSLKAAIDEATGYRASEMRWFIDWFNENVWGSTSESDDEPPFESPELSS